MSGLTETQQSSSDSDEAAYEVEHIVARKIIDDTTYYQIKWKGYSKRWDTWEPMENLESCQDKINNFIDSISLDESELTIDEAPKKGRGRQKKLSVRNSFQSPYRQKTKKRKLGDRTNIEKMENAACNSPEKENIDFRPHCPATPEKVTPENVTLEKVTPEKVTPEKVTPEKVTLEKVTPEKVTPEKVTPEKVTLEKVIPEKAINDEDLAPSSLDNTPSEGPRRRSKGKGNTKKAKKFIIPEDLIISGTIMKAAEPEVNDEIPEDKVDNKKGRGRPKKAQKRKGNEEALSSTVRQIEVDQADTHQPDSNDENIPPLESCDKFDLFDSEESVPLMEKLVTAQDEGNEATAAEVNDGNPENKVGKKERRCRPRKVQKRSENEETLLSPVRPKEDHQATEAEVNDENPENKVGKRGRPRKVQKMSENEDHQDDTAPIAAPIAIRVRHAGNFNPNYFSEEFQAEAILGTTNSGDRTFIVKWVGKEEASCVPANLCNINIPQMVIGFYEKHLDWET